MNTCVAETSVREAKECECQCMEAMELKKTFPPNIEVGDCK